MSQFASLFKTNDKPKTETKSKPQPAKRKAVTSPPPAEKVAPVKNEKRPGAKSSNADYTQVLTYIKKNTHNDVKAALIYDAEKRDLSELVEELLSGWLKKQK